MTEKLAVYAVSLGCPKNRVDTEVMLGLLGPGVVPVDRPEEAGLALVNTCSFIQPAVSESVRTILDLAEALRDLAPRPLLVVAGCLPARYGDELARELPEVDLFIRPDDLHLLPARLAEIRKGIPATPDASPPPARVAERPGRAAPAGGVPAPPRLFSTPPSYAYLKIGEGCDHRCAYCAIPAIRGRLRSRPDEELVAEARSILASGRSEIVLVAQDLTAHGHDLGAKDGLIGLARRLAPLPGLRWLRLMYLYPSGLTDEALDRLADIGPPLLPYFDIPFQHVHPEVLRAMGRPRSDPPEAVVERIRRRFPEAAIRSTFIVGYPGETEARFRILYEAVARMRLDHLGVFAFSPEEGAPAARLPRRISGREKEARRQALMERQRDLSADKLAAWVGRTVETLVDAPHPEWPGLFQGRTWFQAPEVDGLTYVSGPDVAPGRMVSAEIVDAKDYDLVALA